MLQPRNKPFTFIAKYSLYKKVIIPLTKFTRYERLPKRNRDLTSILYFPSGKVSDALYRYCVYTTSIKQNDFDYTEFTRQHDLFDSKVLMYLDSNDAYYYVRHWVGGALKLLLERKKQYDNAKDQETLMFLIRNRLVEHRLKMCIEFIKTRYSDFLEESQD